MTASVISWGVTSLFLLLAVLLGTGPLRRLWLARRRQRLISAYGLARLDNVILEDGIDGHKVLDHILLTPDGLLVLLPRHCDGDLFGGEKIDSWTQMVGGKSYHFENPLYQLEELLATLRYNLPGLPLQGRVLLSGECRFPKGRPENILLLEELGDNDRALSQAVVPVLEQAWQQLQEKPQAEAAEEEGNHAVSRPRLWLAALSLLLGGAWLWWRLMMGDSA